MKTVNAKTKIARIIKDHPDALETIISISSKFEKYRNPLLRKVFVGRTNIAMASEIAGCEMTVFFNKLKLLGFEIDEPTASKTEQIKELPAFITQLQNEKIIDFDVRELLASGRDPLTLILDKIKTVASGQALKIINTFEPVPLIKMLENQGFLVYADTLSDDLVETYFYKKTDTDLISTSPNASANDGWDEIMDKFKGNLITVDVRHLEMPLPMHTILTELDKLPSKKALHVYHKRIPIFLLPELSEKKFEYRINNISDGNVQLLIYKN